VAIEIQAPQHLEQRLSSMLGAMSFQLTERMHIAPKPEAASSDATTDLSPIDLRKVRVNAVTLRLLEQQSCQYSA
jgi:hypothetical protein